MYNFTLRISEEIKEGIPNIEVIIYILPIGKFLQNTFKYKVWTTNREKIPVAVFIYLCATKLAEELWCNSKMNFIMFCKSNSWNYRIVLH